MKALSRTFAFKFVILTASATASIVLISACPRSFVSAHGRPIIMIFTPPGMQTNPDLEKVKKAFQELGDDFCNVDGYNSSGNQVWHVGHLSLKMTAATHSEAAANQASVDPVNVTQKAAFATLDEATDFLTKIK